MSVASPLLLNVRNAITFLFYQLCNNIQLSCVLISIQNLNTYKYRCLTQNKMKATVNFLLYFARFYFSSLSLLTTKIVISTYLHETQLTFLVDISISISENWNIHL